jgi:hypothetical protein
VAKARKTIATRKEDLTREEMNKRAEEFFRKSAPPPTH